MPEQIVKWLIESEKAPTLMAAFAGIFLRYLMRPHLSLRVALFSVVAGLSAAHWGAPPVAEWFELGPNGLGVIGWLCGMLAADLAQGLGVLGRSWAQDPGTFIDRCLGRKPSHRDQDRKD